MSLVIYTYCFANWMIALVDLYYRLQDVIREWQSMGAKGVDDFETKAEW